MAALGLTTLFPMRELALMGLLEVLPKFAALRRRLARDRRRHRARDARPWW